MYVLFIHYNKYNVTTDIEMDATAMAFDSNVFDCVIDKGTLDALMVSLLSFNSDLMHLLSVLILMKCHQN